MDSYTLLLNGCSLVRARNGQWDAVSDVMTGIWVGPAPVGMFTERLQTLGQELSLERN